jgi:kumamolisin
MMKKLSTNVIMIGTFNLPCAGYASGILLALGTALSFGGQALAQTAQPPAGSQLIQRPTYSIVVPSSSLSRPEDLGKAAHTNIRFIMPKDLRANARGVSPLVGPPFAGYGFETPASLACLYGLAVVTTGCNPNSVTAVSTKGSRAVALVDAYDYPTALTDLQKFSTQFGLPAPVLQVDYATATGTCSGPKPSPAAPQGWEGEEALDLQMAHAMAPHAKVILVEAQSSSNTDLLGAVQCANTLVSAAGGGEVSMSWGGSEFSGETAYDTYFSTANIVYFAATGDLPGVSWPSTSQKVVAVGGTSISRGVDSFKFKRYTTWVEAGGGISTQVARPSYQDSISGILGANRGVPDVAADANPDTGVWVYDSNPDSGIGWYVYGGTSVASPLLAGIVNAIGSFQASTNAELVAIYNAKAANATLDFVIPATGYCGPYASYAVATTWNFCAGVGTPLEPLTPLAQQ